MWNRFLSNASACALLLFAPVSAFAAVSISEIMYDVPGSDSGREWIEVQNTGSFPVDISGWKLFEGGVNHKIVAQGASSIPAEGYAVIAANAEKFLADHPGFSAALFQSSFSLSNTGETLSLKNASSTVADSLTYSAGVAAGDGNTLNLAEGGLTPRKASPGGPVSEETLVVSSKKTSAQTGNVTKDSGVQMSDSAATGGAVSNTASAELATGARSEGSSESFAMLPWIAALIAIVGIAGAAIFLKRPSRQGSGYTIIEEK